MNKKKCVEYLGHRGVDREIKKCFEYKNLWFIIFKEYPAEVEVSVKALCYECYTEIPTKDMKWNKSNYEKIKNKIGA
tara:strand:+ start:266 stop:496 length:231 start_codon:yes stop_codon:yes gene_type:complete